MEEPQEKPKKITSLFFPDTPANKTEVPKIPNPQTQAPNGNIDSTQLPAELTEEEQSTLEPYPSLQKLSDNELITKLQMTDVASFTDPKPRTSRAGSESVAAGSVAWRKSPIDGSTVTKHGKVLSHKLSE